MRSVRSVLGAALVFTVYSLTAVGAASSPYPAKLMMQRGLTESAMGRALPWGTKLSAAQSHWVTLSSPPYRGSTFRWGVWRKGGGPSQFPVRSSDGGAIWMAAGPQIASDWAGGGIYFVDRVIWESPTSVVMVSNAVIDVTTDGGHHWYQYLNGLPPL